MSEITPALREVEAMREWARVGLSLYTGAMGAIALLYPEHSQTPLNQPLVAKARGGDA